MGATRLAILCLVLGGLPHSAVAATSLFTGSQIVQISIQIDAAQIAILQNQPRTYVPAQVNVGEEVWEQVGVHIKGRLGSLRSWDDKPSLTLDFNRWRPDQSCQSQTKFHLNNSVEDPTYLNDFLAQEVCQRASIPFPHVTHAMVLMNGKRLGIYVLKQSFEDWLREQKSHPLSLFESVGGGDLDKPFERKIGPEPPPGHTILDLARAAEESIPSLRSERLKAALDLPAFLQFMSLEVLLGHRDGYCMAKNNFRLSFDSTTDRWQFLLSGTDQLLGNPKLSWQPEMSGLVARSVLQVPELQRAYRAEFQRLLDAVFREEPLILQLRQRARLLTSAVPLRERGDWRSACERLELAIRQRRRFLEADLARPEPIELAFQSNRASLDQANWTPNNAPAPDRLRRETLPSGTVALTIQAKDQTSSSWRTRVLLGPGHYVFSGKARLQRVVGIPLAKQKGVRLRVIGFDSTAAPGWEGDQESVDLNARFTLKQPQEVELVCELRAMQGVVWFDLSSLRLEKDE